jgi:hypothetical protein
VEDLSITLPCPDDEHDWGLLYDDSDQSFTLYCRKCGKGPLDTMKGAYIDGLFV